MSTNRIPGSFDISGPVADGDYISEEMDTAYERAYVNIRFFDDNGNDVVPGAGTVVVQLCADSDQAFYEDVLNGSFNAADAYVATRDMPYAEGPARFAKVTLSGVTTATGFRATIQRY